MILVSVSVMVNLNRFRSIILVILVNLGQYFDDFGQFWSISVDLNPFLGDFGLSGSVMVNLNNFRSII